MFSRLYLHIPWCLAKCGYCAFSSRRGTTADLAGTVELLLTEMELAVRRFPATEPLASLYLGGGTPSLLAPDQVGRLLERSRLLWGHHLSLESTLEANPGTVSAERLAGFRAAGITRLSLGAQSFDDNDLTLLGRVHDARQTGEAMSAARAAGFDSVGLDLICGLPGQAPAEWRRQLGMALDLLPDHLSIYSLTIEEGTPFSRRYPAGTAELPDDDLVAAMLEEADTMLTAAGFDHYELANYAKPGKRSEHNCGYWRREGCLGLGPSAHSLLLDGWGVRCCNPSDHDEWAALLRSGSWAAGEETRLSREEARAETMFLGLRLSDGIGLDWFEQRFGERLEVVWREPLQRLYQAGLLRCEAGRLHLTRRGMLLSNRVFVEFL
ncbi:radical SAM family heme chaperone HemW [Trichlorobacter ammonificans]|uniref:Heme chaperone HemW n=1 Tax=Trichlorobacter ammonificans TaxID=2916410 RepID=A0ABM9D5A8_9BACT|nr:radical SAM family heme chaperone HemW [Trichlorobacter ammonificans]CAH2030419.1 Heme chaperone HemW [Trichlorobacter ammonificans]